MMQSRRAWCGWLGALWLACVVAPAAAQSRPKVALSALQQSHAELRFDYADDLQKLIDYCEERQLTEGVAEIRRYLIEPKSTTIRAVSLPQAFQPELAADLSNDERHWRTQLGVRRKEYAKQLYLLSRRALNAGYPGLAFDLVRELVMHDPDHAKGRELLGYVPFEGTWVTPYARSMLLKGYVRHPKFGWILKRDQPRYDAGERQVDGRWMSVEKEAEIRRDFAHAWEIRTDHYLIKTNVSLERGVEFGQALEDFYEFFHQTFAGFFNDPDHLKKVFDGTAPSVSKTPRPYLVNYYKDRDEYITRLKPLFPSIEVTNGIYLTDGRTAHFYLDPQANQDATLFHEATHQLFFESHPLIRPIAKTGHFWIVEGIACYMESFQRENGAFSVGDPRYIRFEGARRNALQEKYYVPLRKFSEMGMRDFQEAPMLAKNYTQAAGLAHFFMQYEEGRYRDAVVNQLVQLYSGNPRKRDFPQGLDELTGETYEELDRQYVEFLQQSQTDAAAARADQAARPVRR